MIYSFGNKIKDDNTRSTVLLIGYKFKVIVKNELLSLERALLKQEQFISEKIGEGTKGSLDESGDNSFRGDSSRDAWKKGS